MSDSLVISLQKQLFDNGKKTSEILSFALFVARKLKNKDVCKLLAPESNGYGVDDPIAPFRILKGDLIASDGDKEIEINLSKPHLIQYEQVKLSISEIESLCERNPGEFFYLPVNNESVEDQIKYELKNNFMHKVKLLGISNGYVSDDLIQEFMPEHKIMLKINRLNYLRIVHIVRAIIQEISLYLEENGFSGDSFVFTEKEIKMSVNNYNIENLNGIIGDVVNSNVTQNNIVDFKRSESLLRESLKDKLVPQNDIDDIANILTHSDIPDSKDSFSSEVKDWMKKMIGKSVDGVWGVGVASAGSILSQIICRYYGLS